MIRMAETKIRNYSPTFDFLRIHKIHPPDDDSDVPCSTSNPNHSLNTPKKIPHTGRT